MLVAVDLLPNKPSMYKNPLVFHSLLILSALCIPEFRTYTLYKIMAGLEEGVMILCKNAICTTKDAIVINIHYVY